MLTDFHLFRPRWDAWSGFLFRLVILIVSLLVAHRYLSIVGCPEIIRKIVFIGFLSMILPVICYAFLNRVSYSMKIHKDSSGVVTIVERYFFLLRKTSRFSGDSRIDVVFPTTLKYRLPFIKIEPLLSGGSAEVGGPLGRSSINAVKELLERFTEKRIGTEFQMMMPRVGKKTPSKK